MSKIEQKENFRVLESLVDSDKLIFVFTAMGISIPLFATFVRGLNKRGYNVVIYDYPKRLVLDAQLDAFGPLYKAIKADADQRIARLMPQQIYSYGISMGTVFAHRLASDTPQIHKVILWMTYGDIATNIMRSPVTAKTRKAMVRRGYSESDVRRGVQFLDPIQNAAGLIGKRVWLHLAKKDRVLTYDTSIKTKQAFEAAVIDLKYTESPHLGHYGNGLVRMFSAKQVDEFYRS